MTVVKLEYQDIDTFEVKGSDDNVITTTLHNYITMCLRQKKGMFAIFITLVVLIIISTLLFESGIEKKHGLARNMKHKGVNYTVEKGSSTLLFESGIGKKHGLARNIQHKGVNYNVEKGSNPLNIFYFGVTHHTTRHRLLACNKTWVQTLPSMHWYSDRPDPEINVTVVSNNGNDSYMDITYRALLIYKHVYENHKGYDWYVRLWDDTYIFRDRLETLLKTQKPEYPVVIGELRKKLVKSDEDEELWLGGGPGWVLSYTGLNTWFESVNSGIAIHKACKVETLGQHLQNIPKKLRFAEDIFLSQCMLSLGIHLVHSYGFLTLPPKDLQGIVDGKTFQQKLGQPKDPKYKFCGYTTCINKSKEIGVITVHYIMAKEMSFLYDQYKQRIRALNQEKIKR